MVRFSLDWHCREITCWSYHWRQMDPVCVLLDFFCVPKTILSSVWVSSVQRKRIGGFMSVAQVTETYRNSYQHVCREPDVCQHLALQSWCAKKQCKAACNSRQYVYPNGCDRWSHSRSSIVCKLLLQASDGRCKDHSLEGSWCMKWSLFLISWMDVKAER